MASGLFFVVCQHVFMRTGPQLSSKLMNVRWYCKAISRESPTGAGDGTLFFLYHGSMENAAAKDMHLL